MQYIRLFSIVFLLFSLSTAQAQMALPVKESGKWGLIGETGQWILPPTYAFISDFNEAGMAIFKENGRSGLLGRQGQVLIPAQYDKLEFFPQQQRIAAWQNGLIGLLDAQGKALLPPTYQAISSYNAQAFLVYSQEKFGLVNAQGEAKLPIAYDQIEPFDGGLPLASVTQGGKMGLINTQLELVAEAVFDEISFEWPMAYGKKGIAITVFRFDEQGKALDRKEYANQTAVNMAKQAAERKQQTEVLRTNPDARKPRWVPKNLWWALENGVGQNLLGTKEFFDINPDAEVGLTFAQEIIKPTEKGQKEVIKGYLIDDANAKILFEKQIKDMVLTDYTQSNWARATVDTLWDALISKSGELITQIDGKKINNIGNFQSGMAWVKSGNLFGYVNGEGKLVIPFQFDVASDFSGKYAIGRKGGLFGAFDQTGKTIIPFEYEGIDVPNEGICRVKKGKGKEGRWGAVDLQNKPLIPFEYSVIYPFKNGEARMRKEGKWGLIDAKGKVLMQPTVEVDEMTDFVNGIAFVGKGKIVEQTPNGPVTRFRAEGFVQRNGVFLIAPEYTAIEGFEAIWAAQQGIAVIKKGAKMGYVNYKGQIVLPAEYDQVENYEAIWKTSSGLARAQKNGKFGFIDHNGQEVLPVEYDFVDTTFARIHREGAGLCKAAKNRKFGYINHLGEPIIPLLYDQVGELQNNVAIVKMGNKWGAVTTGNKTVLEIAYDGIRFLAGSEGTLLEVFRQNDQYYLYSGEGAVVRQVPASEAQSLISPAKPSKSDKYTYATDFDAAGFAVVKKDELLAVVDKAGNLITKYKYDEIAPFSEGLAMVRLANKDREKRLVGYINTKGEEVIAPQFKFARSFGGKFAEVQQGTNWGYIDQTGKWAIKAQFKTTTPFSGGRALVNGNQIIDEVGAVTGEFKMDGKIVDGFQYGRAIVQTTTGSFHLTDKGLPAYFAKYDEVTPFVNQVAFVKRGEVWELTRRLGDQESRLRFNLAQKNTYIAQYGERRSEKNPFGVPMKDVEWNKLINGKWRMIDQNGNFLNDVVYETVVITPDWQILAKPDRLLGIANLEGKFLLEMQSDVIRRAAPGIFRVESAGKLGYLRSNGKWVWELK